MDKERPWIAMTQEQKMGVLFLLIFGVLTVGLGFLQLRNTIYGPFVIHPDASQVAAVVPDEKTRLKTIDTDHDGLSDYDELYVYGSSPYLASTASDGVSDLTKVMHGEDPNCPEGQTCGTSAALPTSSSSVLSPLISIPSGTDILREAAHTAGQGGAGQPKVDFTKMVNDPVALRGFILATGKIKKEDLDKIDDATLLQYARQLLTQQNATST